MDGGAWWAAVHGVAKSRTWLHFHFSLSCVGERNGSPLQDSCLENPRDGGAWWAAVYGVAQSQTRLKWLSSSSSSSTSNTHLKILLSKLLKVWLPVNNVRKFSTSAIFVTRQISRLVGQLMLLLLLNFTLRITLFHISTSDFCLALNL